MEKNQYIVPQIDSIIVNVEQLMTNNSEPEWSGWIGGKESGEFEEEENSDLGLSPTNPNLWGSDED